MPNRAIEYRSATFSLETRAAGERVLVARMVPYGEVGQVRGSAEAFEPGALEVPDRTVPLVLDHGRGVLERIGRLTGLEERTDGAYGTFEISDTDNGRDAHTLLRDGVIDSVSVGFVPGEQEDRGGVLTRTRATLDHLAVVDRGAYEGAAPVAVRNQAQETSTMDETTIETAPETTEPVETRAAEPVTAELAEATEDRIRSLEALVEGLQSGGAEIEERRATAGEVAHLIVRANRGDDAANTELRALAQDSTTTAAGIVPDYYSREIISVIDTARPFVADLDSDPAGDHGLDIVYPKVTQKPLVGKQSAEAAEVASQQFTIGTQTVTLDTFAGANAVSVQTLDRSTPSFLEAFYRELAGIYAQETEQEAEADVLGASGIGTSVLATTATLAETLTGLVAATVGIAKAVKRMPTHLWVSPDRWGQLADLVDGDGRPVFPWSSNGPVNALGQMSLTAPDGQVAALRLRMVPNFATGTMILGYGGAAATLEVPNQQLRALRLSTLEWELGVYGYFATAVKYAAGFHSFTTS